MKKYLNQLQNNALFNHFNLSELESILNCLSAKVNAYDKKDIIIQQGTPAHYVGIILSGGAQIIKEDIEGNISILSHLRINDIFAEAFAYAAIDEYPITVQATEHCEIMFMDCKRIIKTCHNTCALHWILINNMLSIIARKNILLNEKMEILSKRTTREKLLAFFNTQIQMHHSKNFTIPYNREGLAFYLCVDRSALSRELSNMQDEGLIKFNKNEFEIL